MKVCSWCAEELPDDARVCSHCGRDPGERQQATARRPSASSSDPPLVAGVGPPPLPGFPPFAGRDVTGNNRLAVASLAAALLGYPLSFLVGVLALIAEIVAVALGVSAVREIRRTNGRGVEFAWVAIALGGLGILGYAVALSSGASLIH